MIGEELALADLLHREAEKESDARERAPAGRDLDPVGAESVPEQPLAAHRCHAPELAPWNPGAVETADDRNGREANTAGAKRPMDALDGSR